jgi:hypothetical protein
LGDGQARDHAQQNHLGLRRGKLASCANVARSTDRVRSAVAATVATPASGANPSLVLMLLAAGCSISTSGAVARGGS